MNFALYQFEFISHNKESPTLSGFVIITGTFNCHIIGGAIPASLKPGREHIFIWQFYQS